MAPTRHATRPATGVVTHTTTSARPNASKAVPRSLMALERRVRRAGRRACRRLHPALVPEREGQESPELAAEVLAARHVGVDHRAHRFGPEVALAAQRV